jgi:hypothetical protein
MTRESRRACTASSATERSDDEPHSVEVGQAAGRTPSRGCCNARRPTLTLRRARADASWPFLAGSRRLRHNVAVIDSRARGQRGFELPEDEYTSEVIHRHAHRFFEQESGTRFLYRCMSRRTALM